MARLLAAPTLCALALATAGCGGDDAGGGKPLDKPTFITRADAICKEVADDARARLTGPDAPNPSDPNSVADSIERNREDGRKVLERLRDLNPPQDATLDRFFAESQKVSDRLGDVVDATRERDQAAATTAVGAAQQANTAAGNAAREFGFKRCGVGG